MYNIKGLSPKEQIKAALRKELFKNKSNVCDKPSRDCYLTSLERPEPSLRAAPVYILVSLFLLSSSLLLSLALDPPLKAISKRFGQYCHI